MDDDIKRECPVVSISLITYNHAPYIRACLDSMLAQQTSFSYEICVGEDESVDGTREICVEYAERHPDRIRLFLRSQSELGREAYMSQGVYNYIETTKACRGKYLALCDGDDAWIDPLKLQKQFDIMEADPAVSLVHSDYDKKDGISGRSMKKSAKKSGSLRGENSDEVLFRYDVIQGNYPIAASTAFMRTQDALDIFEHNQEIFRLCPMGDTPTWCELIGYGSFYYIDEVQAIYRIVPGSESNSKSAERKYRFVNGTSNLGLMVGEKYNLPMGHIRSSKIKNCNRYALLSGDLSEINRLHDNKDYTFSLAENGIYHLARLNMVRPMVKKVFQLRHLINHRLSNGIRTPVDV